MPISEAESTGLRDLFLNEKNASILVQLAKSLIKNITTISNPEEALNIVLIHGNDTTTILNKKIITKEIIFKYLNERNIPVELNITKAALIAKTLDLWKTPNTRQVSQEKCVPSGEIAIAFAEWFFKKYNSNEVVETDFYPDADMSLRILANDGTEDNKCTDATSIVELLAIKNKQFGFYFNLNSSETGVRGILDIHGMLLVLTCGTLHSSETCLGVFEMLFGLLRDPFGQNAWKIKTIRGLWRSQQSPSMPTLDNNESFDAVIESGSLRNLN